MHERIVPLKQSVFRFAPGGSFDDDAVPSPRGRDAGAEFVEPTAKIGPGQGQRVDRTGDAAKRINETIQAFVLNGKTSEEEKGASVTFGTRFADGHGDGIETRRGDHAAANSRERTHVYLLVARPD